VTFGGGRVPARDPPRPPRRPRVDMEQLLEQLTNGLAVGSIYALIALGYTMVYGVL